MFTGLIEEIGTVLSLQQSAGTCRITVASDKLAPQLKLGDSIAVSGVCLTAVELGADRFSADLAHETMLRTSLIQLAAGRKLNLELPTRAGTPLGGHVVQGHVDGTGHLRSLAPIKEGASDTDW